MTIEQRSVRQTTETPGTPENRTSTVVERTDVQPSGGEMLRRAVVLIFGIIQAFIVARIALLLLDAREANALVAFILDVSQLFVAPFIGIFQVDALRSSGSILDVAAIAALVGWTILELIVIWAVNLMRREPV
jgi:TctA family transporter